MESFLRRVLAHMSGHACSKQYAPFQLRRATSEDFDGCTIL